MAKYILPQDRTFITTDYMRKRYGQYDPNIFQRWTKQGKVKKVRNGVYRATDVVMRSEWDHYLIANKLQYPSYISLHSAFHFYNLIPEYVYHPTSVSTKKTQTYDFQNICYTFQQLKPELFFGYQVFSWRGVQIRIALLEKAIIDFAYLEPLFIDSAWLEEMRFDEDVLQEEVNWNIMDAFAKNINSTILFEKLAALRKTYNL